MKKRKQVLSSIVLSLILFVQVLSGCGNSANNSSQSNSTVATTVKASQSVESSSTQNELNQAIDNEPDIEKAENDTDSNSDTELQNSQTASSKDYTSASVPAFNGYFYVELDGNVPSFSDSEKVTTAFENYSELDELKRCGVAYANICKEIMPTEKRGAIGSVKPTGWHTMNYHELVDGNYLYNRCHLIAFELAGENANVKNLITGTRYLNVKGMLPYENSVAKYVKSTNNHVLYRVTPVFEGDNLVATGVKMEAWSVEDNGAGICFNIFVYNVQPGIAIDYATGDSWVDSSIQIIADSSSSSNASTIANSSTNSSVKTSQSNVSNEQVATSEQKAQEVAQQVEKAKQEEVSQTASSKNDDVQSGNTRQENQQFDTLPALDEKPVVDDDTEAAVVDDDTSGSGEMVWVASSGNGKKYHSNPNCSNMKNPNHVTKEQAIASGKTACSKCY